MKTWKNAVIGPDTPILEAIRILDEASMQICLVVDDRQALVGTITDGDIRRGILRQVALADPVGKIMNTSPQTVGPDKKDQEILDLMASLSIHQIPVIDEAGRVLDLKAVDHLVSARVSKPNWVVLMAGGLGSRLHPITETVPKPMIPVGSKPVLETILENFVEQGFRNFYISVNYKAEMVEEYFGDGSRWCAEIRYLHEDVRLGTAGPLGLIDEIPENPLLVMNGDLLTRVKFENILTYHHERAATATMAVREYDFQVPFGVVQIEDTNIVGIDEKPVHKFFVNAGIYVIEPDVLSLIDRGKPHDMPDVFQLMIDTKKTTSVFPVREYWLDIGRLDDLDQANREFDANFNNR